MAITFPDIRPGIWMIALYDAQNGARHADIPLGPYTIDEWPHAVRMWCDMVLSGVPEFAISAMIDGLEERAGEVEPEKSGHLLLLVQLLRCTAYEQRADILRSNMETSEIGFICLMNDIAASVGHKAYGCGLGESNGS